MFLNLVRKIVDIPALFRKILKKFGKHFSYVSEHGACFGPEKMNKKRPNKNIFYNIT